MRNLTHKTAIALGLGAMLLLAVLPHVSFGACSFANSGCCGSAPNESPCCSTPPMESTINGCTGCSPRPAQTVPTAATMPCQWLCDDETPVHTAILPDAISSGMPGMSQDIAETVFPSHEFGMCHQQYPPRYVLSERTVLHTPVYLTISSLLI